MVSQERKKEQLRLAVLALEVSVEEKALKGAQPPEEREALELQYTVRKQIVLKLIRDL